MTPGRVAWAGGFNIMMEDPIEVAREMEDVAAIKDRCTTPVYHLSLSWHPDDDPTQPQMELAAQRVLVRLGLQEHQAWLVAHNDKPHALVHIMVNRVSLGAGCKVWDGWRHGRPGAFRAIESELRRLEQEMGWTITPGHEPPDWWRTGSRYRMCFGAEITIRMGPNAQSWKVLHAVLQGRGMRIEARPRGLVIIDGSRYIGASRIRGLKGSRPELEERFGQTLNDFLATGQSPEPVPMADWMWKVRLDSMYHVRRNFNKTPELYALYRDTLAWCATERARMDVERQERRLAWHRSALRRAEREAGDTRWALLQGIRHLLRGHAGLEAAMALAALTAALAKLGVDGVLAVMRQNPDRVGLPAPARKWRRKGDGTAPLESELRAYAFAQRKSPSADRLAECRRAVQEAEQALRAERRPRWRGAPRGAGWLIWGRAARHCPVSNVRRSLPTNAGRAGGARWRIAGCDGYRPPGMSTKESAAKTEAQEALCCADSGQARTTRARGALEASSGTFTGRQAKGRLIGALFIGLRDRSQSCRAGV